jgi:hypothetical protein
MGKENGCQYSINNSTLTIHSIAQGLHLVSRPSYEAQSLACDLLFSFTLLTGVTLPWEHKTVLGVQLSPLSLDLDTTLAAGPHY